MAVSPTPYEGVAVLLARASVSPAVLDAMAIASGWIVEEFSVALEFEYLRRRINWPELVAAAVTNILAPPGRAN